MPPRCLLNGKVHTDKPLVIKNIPKVNWLCWTANVKFLSLVFFFFFQRRRHLSNKWVPFECSLFLSLCFLTSGYHFVATRVTANSQKKHRDLGRLVPTECGVLMLVTIGEPPGKLFWSVEGLELPSNTIISRVLPSKIHRKCHCPGRRSLSVHFQPLLFQTERWVIS